MTDRQGIEKLVALYAAKIDEADKLAKAWEGKESDMPRETAEQIDKLLGEADAAKAKVHLLKRLEEGRDLLDESQGTRAAHLGWRPAGPGEGLVEVDAQSWREVEIKTFEVDRSGMIAPVTRTLRVHVPEAVQQKGYAPAFEAYLRKRAFADLGPTDRKTLSEGTDSAGGFLVPPDVHIEIIKKAMTAATVRPNARVVQTSRDIAQWPKIAYTTDDKYTSGVRLTWTGETPASSSAHRVTDPSFGLYSVPVNTAMASMPITNALLEDSAFDVWGVASDLIGEAFALGENDAFWNGNGIARPMGILAQVDGDGPASVASGTASALTADGIIALWGALPSQYEPRAKWYFNKSTEAAIRKLKDSQNNYLWPVWPQVGGFGPAPRELLGFPTVRDEFVPSIAANAYPIVFGDLSGYLVVDRVGLSIQKLSELYAETDITLLLARKRVGGQLVQPWRVKVQRVAAS